MSNSPADRKRRRAAVSERRTHAKEKRPVVGERRAEAMERRPVVNDSRADPKDGRTEVDEPPADSTDHPGPPTVDAIFGIQPVRALLRSGQGVQRLLMARGRQGAALRAVRDEARRAGLPVVLRERVELDRLTDGGVHQGVVAIAPARPYADRNAVLSALEPPAFLVVLDGVEDPRNLGAILRTAAATGTHGVFVPARRAVGLGPTVVKASAGTAGQVPVVRETNLARLLEDLKRRDIWTVAVEAGAPPPWEGFDLSLPVALVLGGEGRGLRRLVRSRCDAAIGLPLAEGVESLNVAVAFGAVAYELQRQRQVAGGPATPGRRGQHVGG